MKIKGKKVVLQPIKPEENDEFYQLAAESYGSKFWSDDEERARRTKKEFFEDWNQGYFDVTSPEKGQCFWIMADNKKIGQINYNKIDTQNKKVELDIIIGEEEHTSRGYGTDALRTLMRYLFDNFDIHKIWIEARANNPRAVRAYEKVGFKKEGILRKENYFEKKFVDCVRFGILKKEL